MKKCFNHPRRNATWVHSLPGDRTRSDFDYMCTECYMGSQCMLDKPYKPKKLAVAQKTTVVTKKKGAVKK